MKTRAQKEVTLTSIKEKLTRARAVVLTDYKGMNMGHLSELRKQLRPQNAELTITKNTLLQIALKDAGMATGDIDGPTATLFAYDDEITPIKILVKNLKDNSIGKIMSGFLGSSPLDAAKVVQLSTLPTKEELRGKVVGVLVAPLTGMVNVLNGNLRGLVYALDQIRKQKGGEITS